MTQAEVDKFKRERIIIVVIQIDGAKSIWSSKDILNEMQELVIACGGHVIDSVDLRLHKPSAKLLISEGKAKDIAELCHMKDIDTVIFSHDLKGTQQRNLEDIITVKTIDRTQLILDIFARHATSKEGKMQVELAQLEYLLPRLVGKGIELSRLGGGIGTLGPGETKLEIDRRKIGQRITKLKRNLSEVSDNRTLKRKKRKDKGVPTLTLVGYTNAGKSTLLNTLTSAGQKTKDGLFTTLDSLSRHLILPNHQRVVVSDTVGFMHQLPHHLIESFKATLEEVKQADLLLHVLDVSHQQFRHLHESVLNVLKELESVEKPTITVLNKIDCLDDPSWVERLEGNFENAVCISALNHTNIDKLHEAIEEKLSGLIREIDVYIPINRMDLVHLAHDEGEVYAVKYYNDSINIRASVPVRIAAKFMNRSLSKG